jgi:hypothetical protein
MGHTRLEFPIYKDDYEIIRDEVRSINILKCGSIHKVRHYIGNDKYALLMININHIKELKIEENIKKFIFNGYVIKHWLYSTLHDHIFMGKVPIDNSKIDHNQWLLRSTFYFAIVESRNMQRIIIDLNFVEEEIDLT